MSIPRRQSSDHQASVTYVNSSQPFAVVVGACGHGLSVIRALHTGDVPIIAIEADPLLPGIHTKLASVEMIPDIQSPYLIQSLLELRIRIQCPGNPVLFLTNDKMIRVVGEHWERLQGFYNLSWSHSRHALLPLLEKASLEHRSSLQGLLYPKTFVLTAIENVDQAIQAIGFPIFVKPARPLSRFKTAQPQTREALEDLAKQFSSDLPFLIQQFIPGDDTNIYFTALYLDHGKILARFDGHKLRSRPLGHTTVAEAYTDDEVFKQTSNFFAELNLSGPVSLELKRDQQGVLWVIEPTVGRTDFWIHLCTSNGVNLPYIEYQHQAIRPIPNSLQTDRAVWFNEERDPFGRLWFLTQPNMRLGNRKATYLFLHGSDIKPAINALKKIITNLANSALNRTKRSKVKFDLEMSSHVQSYEISDVLPYDIQQLFSTGEREDIEFGLTWYKNLIENVYPAESGVRIYVLRVNGLAMAAMPVHEIKNTFDRKIESLCNYYTTLYAPVIAPGVGAHSLSILISRIVSANVRVSTFRLAPMELDAESYRLLMESFRLAGFVPNKFFCFGNWFQPIGEDWKTYLNSRDSKLKNTIKRKAKHLSTAKGSLELITGGVELSRGLSAYKHVYAQSWKKPEPFPEFIPGLMQVCADNGWLRLGIAWLNGNAIAAQFWIVANGKASIYKLAYDERFKTYAPGTLLTAMLMEHVIEEDHVTEVDYLIGDDPYKKTWMDHRRERWGIIAYNPATLTGLIGLGRAIAGRMFKILQVKFSGFKLPSLP